MPHFRAQMNTVPGMVTRLKMRPTITTDSMRTITGNDKFDYILLCNKICGAAHYNMQMKIVVEKEDDYNNWYKQQATFAGAPVKEESTEEKNEEENAEVSADSTSLNVTAKAGN
jgi:cytochrome c oxidase subunit II